MPFVILDVVYIWDTDAARRCMWPLMPEMKRVLELKHEFWKHATPIMKVVTHGIQIGGGCSYVVVTAVSGLD
jgi:hypothetical protein